MLCQQRQWFVRELFQSESDLGWKRWAVWCAFGAWYYWEGTSTPSLASTFTQGCNGSGLICSVSFVTDQLFEHPECASPQWGSACPCPWGRAVLLLPLCCCLLSVQSEECHLSNHRMVCVEKDLQDHLVPTPLAMDREMSTRPGCSKPCPT